MRHWPDNGFILIIIKLLFPAPDTTYHSSFSDELRRKESMVEIWRHFRKSDDDKSRLKIVKTPERCADILEQHKLHASLSSSSGIGPVCKISLLTIGNEQIGL